MDKETVNGFLKNAIKWIVGVSVGTILVTVGPEIQQAASKQLQPIWESGQTVGLAPFQDVIGQAPWKALETLGPASAMDLAMDAVLENPNRLKGRDLKDFALEAVDARESKAASEALLTSMGFAKPEKLRAGIPTIPLRWKAAHDQLLRELAPDGTLNNAEAAFGAFHRETVVADGALAQTKKLLAATGVSETSPEGKDLLEKTKTEAMAAFSDTNTPLETKELATALLECQMSGVAPKWSNAEPRGNARLGALPIPETEIKPKNTGKPRTDIIIVGENHSLAKDQDLKAMMESLRKKGFKTLSLEMPLDGKIPDAAHPINKATAYAKSKGWKVEYNDVPAATFNAMNERRDTLEKWAVTAMGKNKNPTPLIDAMVESNEASIKTRSEFIAARLLGSGQGKTLHIGGSAHTTEIQDEMAAMSGGRPLGIQVVYGNEVTRTLLESQKRSAEFSANSHAIKQEDLGRKLTELVPTPKQTKAGPGPTMN